VKNDIKRFTQEVRIAVPIASWVDGMLGVFYTTEDSEFVSTARASDYLSGATIENGYDYIFDQIARYEERAVFANLTFHATERLDLQVGGRSSGTKQSYRSVTTQSIFTGNGTHNTDVTPTTRADASPFTFLVTPSFKMAPDMLAYGRLASGFRAGGPSTPNCLLDNFPCQYGPDKTLNYELGFKGNFLNRMLSVDASLYYIDWDDIQLFVFTPVTDTGSFGYTSNAGQAKSQGAELSMDFRPLTGLAIAGWVAWNDAVLTEDTLVNPNGNTDPSDDVVIHRGDRLPFGAEWSGRLSVSQEFQMTGAADGYVEWAVNYVGERGAGIGSVDPNNYPSYTTVDASVGMRARSGWSANLFLTNVADERATHTGNPVLGTVVYVQPRTIGLNISRQW
jgi:outer membrane receptor protein involved in Fe transport